MVRANEINAVLALFCCIYNTQWNQCYESNVCCHDKIDNTHLNEYDIIYNMWVCFNGMNCITCNSTWLKYRKWGKFHWKNILVGIDEYDDGFRESCPCRNITTMKFILQNQHMHCVSIYIKCYCCVLCVDVDTIVVVNSWIAATGTGICRSSSLLFALNACVT